jgi:hypothetical protein
MKKTIALALLSGVLLLSAGIQAQEPESLNRPNEFHAGYGAFSTFYFTNNNHNYHGYDSYYYDEDEPSSPGTFFIGYKRQVSRLISVGIDFSYTYRTNSYRSRDYYDSVYSSGTSTDHLLCGLTKVTIGYINKPFLRLYSAAAIGLTVDLNSSTIEGIEYTDRTIKPAGQLTLFGLRAGKALGGFVEFGVGTNGIILAGISYQFKD